MVWFRSLDGMGWVQGAVFATSLGSVRHDSPAGDASGGAEDEEGEEGEEAPGSVVSLMSLGVYDEGD